ncbi:polyadenylate-binding protein-interacting protein 1 [Denticeps clupeoides]|uniref:Polyadenylate-binding protein-interacting protein 1 n=1 Tax=Denticeps clupeoides TaxID=299321 RepID=A0AAY4DF44_9TELE|nr:polyadenylate-binding protein-interacting protein 1 [Denticeps clupeoides]
MADSFDRAPGAGRVRGKPSNPGLVEASSPRAPEFGSEDAKASLFSHREPLRQPRSSPPPAEDTRRQSKTSNPVQNNSSTPALKAQRSESLVLTSSLSANAPEFYPSDYAYSEPVYEDWGDEYYASASLADLVQGILSHLNSSPGSFEVDIDDITATLNEWVTTEDTLKELVELIYMQSTSIPNFSYTGARLCNYLSQHLIISPSNGSFRHLLLQRCHSEFEKKNQAVCGNEETQRKFHSYVLFLGEIYLNLEVKSANGPPKRADILLVALKDLLTTLFSNPVDGNLTCAVKLLKLTGSVLEDTWKEMKQPHMDEIMQKIKGVVLDATCSRDVRQMLLKLVELRSSNWGRVHAAAAASEATPYNDPNYFMNEPTFYTEDGTPFTAADPDYSEKYQEILDREEYFPDYEENGNEPLFPDTDEDEMDPEIEEAFEKFCIESERKWKQ